MQSIMRRAGMLILALLVILPVTLYAWGPMTHLTVNERAYERAIREIGNHLAIPRELADDFIGGGPCPDIKSQGGASFPYKFHNDPDTVVRMIELAKADPETESRLIGILHKAQHLFGHLERPDFCHPVSPGEEPGRGPAPAEELPGPGGVTLERRRAHPSFLRGSFQLPLTPTLSPTSGGEGARSSPRAGRHRCLSLSTQWGEPG